MKFRTRDAIAALLAVILGKIAWTDSTGPESLAVSTVLAFYYEATPSVTVEHEVHPDDDAYDDIDDAYDDDDVVVDDDEDDDGFASPSSVHHSCFPCRFDATTRLPVSASSNAPG